MNQHWIRRTAVFLTGQTITLFGSSIVQFAISWHITLITKSGWMVTISTLCGFLPQVLISLFAGVWADRYDRKKLIIFADGLIAAFTAILAILFLVGYDKLWLLFFISAIRSIGAGVQTPAVSSFLTELVPQDKLMRVNGLNASIQGIMFLLSPAAAGGLYKSLGLGSVFWVDVITAVAGISLLLFLRVPPHPSTLQEKPHFFADMFSGISYVFGTSWLLQYMIFFLLISLMFGPIVFLTPLMVARSFGDEPWRLVWHEIVFSAGSIAGGLAVGMLNNRFRNKVLMVIYACAAFGITVFVMGFSPNFWFYLGVMLPMGMTMPFINTGSMTVLQTRVQPEFIGRVFGLVSIISSTAMPLSIIVFGPLADRMKIEHQLIITGTIIIIISLTMLQFKEIRQAGEPTPEELHLNQPETNDE